MINKFKSTKEGVYLLIFFLLIPVLYAQECSVVVDETSAFGDLPEGGTCTAEITEGLCSACTADFFSVRCDAVYQPTTGDAATWSGSATSSGCDTNSDLCSQCYTWSSTANKCCGDDSGETWCDGSSPTMAGCDSNNWISDPDNSEYVCETCADKAWSTQGFGCCGDDGGDCGIQSTNLCFDVTTVSSTSGLEGGSTSSSSDWNWASAAATKGTVFFVNCGGYEVLSTGTSWVKCPDNFNSGFYTVDHQYLCAGTGEKTIVECCGGNLTRSSDCDSLFGSTYYGGSRNTTGNSVDYNSVRYFCSDSYKWISNLDTTNEYTCEAAEDPGGENLGYNWTTTNCCGDDASEIYSDPLTGPTAINAEACWNGAVLNSCSQLSNDNTTINENGTLYGCGASDPGITALNYCRTTCGNNYFCSYDNKWVDSEGRNRNTSSSWPNPSALPADAREFGCCEPTSCWNGTTCLSDQSSTPNNQPYNGYRCIAGSWEGANLTYNWDRTASGYCAKANQCLVNPSSTNYNNGNLSSFIHDYDITYNNNIQCINSGQYIGDHYCENNNWTTRTKLVALQLLGIPAVDNYTLFCDSYSNTLNYYGYTEQGTQAQQYITYKDGVNKFCVLKYNDKAYFGASLNRPLDDSYLPFLNLLKGVGSCTISNTNSFVSCDASNKAWWNNVTQTVIYSNETFTLPSAANYNNLLKTPADTMISSIMSSISTNGQGFNFDYSYVTKINDFDRLYINRLYTKTIRGTINERENIYTITNEYLGFNNNICSLIDLYDTRKGGSNAGIACYPSSTNYRLIAQGSSYIGFNPSDFWTDLTSEMRAE
ncbi:hypothetical protein J4209_05720 [Candidatus Woesearchaeota archaeon]|nr:hypothetical protein [Candidatus Woesearchaeota archaeon]